MQVRGGDPVLLPHPSSGFVGSFFISVACIHSARDRHGWRVRVHVIAGTLSLPAVKVLESWIEHTLKQRDAPAPRGRQLGYIYPKGLSPDGCQDAFAELSARGPGGQYEEITRTTLFNALMLLGDHSNSGTLPPWSLAAPGRQKLSSLSETSGMRYCFLCFLSCVL